MLCFVTQSCLTLLDPMDCSQPGSSVHGDSPGKNTGVGCHALLQGTLPTQGLNPDLPHCRVDSLPSEPAGKPQNTGVDSLSLLQGIFLSQESNWGLLHCRQIFHQLNYQGSREDWKYPTMKKKMMINKRGKKTNKQKNSRGSMCIIQILEIPKGMKKKVIKGML